MTVVLNGRLPDALLVYLPWPEASYLRLRPDAAASAGRMAAAFERDLGYPLRLTDAYRTYAVQVSLKLSKPTLAATAGKSVHGWGLAIDAASGVNSETSRAHRWMDDNAWLFGWINPAWAQDYDPANGAHEPWHWEYHAELDDHGITAATTPPEDDMYSDADRARDDATYGWLREMQPVVVTNLPYIKGQVTALDVDDTRTRIGNIQYALGLLLARAPGETVTAADIAAAIPANLAQQVADELSKRLAS